MEILGTYNRYNNCPPGNSIRKNIDQAVISSFYTVSSGDNSIFQQHNKFFILQTKTGKDEEIRRDKHINSTINLKQVN